MSARDFDKTNTLSNTSLAFQMTSKKKKLARQARLASKPWMMRRARKSGEKNEAPSFDGKEVIDTVELLQVRFARGLKKNSMIYV